MYVCKYTYICVHVDIRVYILEGTRICECIYSCVSIYVYIQYTWRCTYMFGLRDSTCLYTSRQRPYWIWMCRNTPGMHVPIMQWVHIRRNVGWIHTRWQTTHFETLLGTVFFNYSLAFVVHTIGLRKEHQTCAIPVVYVYIYIYIEHQTCAIDVVYIYTYM